MENTSFLYLQHITSKLTKALYLTARFKVCFNLPININRVRAFIPKLMVQVIVNMEATFLHSVQNCNGVWVVGLNTNFFVNFGVICHKCKNYK